MPASGGVCHEQRSSEQHGGDIEYGDDIRGRHGRPDGGELEQRCTGADGCGIGTFDWGIGSFDWSFGADYGCFG